MYPILSTGSPNVQQMMMLDNGALRHIEVETPEIEIEINFEQARNFKRAVYHKLCDLHSQTIYEQGGDSAVKNIMPVLKMQGVTLDKAFQPAIDAQTQLAEKQKSYQRAIRKGFTEKIAQTKAEVGQSLRSTAGQILGGVPDVSPQSLTASQSNTTAEESLQDKLKKQLKKPWVMFAGIALGLFVLGYFVWLINPKAPFSE